MPCGRSPKTLRQIALNTLTQLNCQILSSRRAKAPKAPAPTTRAHRECREFGRREWLRLNPRKSPPTPRLASVATAVLWRTHRARASKHASATSLSSTAVELAKCVTGSKSALAVSTFASLQGAAAGGRAERPSHPHTYERQRGCTIYLEPINSSSADCCALPCSMSSAFGAPEN